MIENKVYAGESERQLKTYWEWMCNQTADYKALLFLTPKGRESTTAESAPYYKLSYGDDIYNWLSQTLGDVQSPVLQAIIQQYRQLALSLKGNS